MTTPPPPPGPPGPQPNQPGPGPYGQQPGPYGPGGYGQGHPGSPYGQGQPGSPYGQPPKKGGVPTWAWIVGAVVALLLVCGCGGIGLLTVLGSDDDPPVTPGIESSTSEPSDTTTTDPTTDAPTTDAPTTTPEPTTTPTVPSSTVPPTPSGSKPNTDSRNTLPSGDVEGQVAKGMAGFGHTKSDISCPDDLVLIKDKKTTCTAPIPGDSSKRSDVNVTVDWAVIESNNQISYYLSFRQSLN